MWIKGVFLVFFGAGIFALMQIVMPVLAFKTWEVTSLNQSQLLVNPNLSSSSLIEGQTAGVSVQNIDNFPAFISSLESDKNPSFKEFKLSIPSINLNSVKVLVNSNDFEQNLAHLPGTALPGEKGNVFISGHSSLPFIFGTDRKPLFMDLPKVKKGDEIKVEVLGQQLKYEVMGIKIVNPNDVSVINPPNHEGRYMSLMTCVPPGFNTKRLIVLAKLK